MLRPPTMASRPSTIHALLCMRRLTLQKRTSISIPRRKTPSRHRIRIEQAHLDVRMLVQCAIVGIAAPRVDIVEKQPDPDATVGRLDHLVGEQAAGQVVLPVVVLQVEASLGMARGGGAQRESLHVVGQEPQPGLLRGFAPEAARSRCRVPSGCPRRPRPTTAFRTAGPRTGHRGRPRPAPQGPEVRGPPTT